jgi:class 3 adenylate cyclase/tetratricopeptide (TPR) repeat protein
MSGISEWLTTHGLERYAPAFVEAEIDVPTLALLTDEDLRELGLPLGPRRKILREASTPPSPAEGAGAAPAERRQITVMFVDLVGSTRLSTRFDPEILGELLESYKAAVAEEVAQAGGTVAKYLGDGVLAYFGWPKAREDAAECAIRCAFHIRDRIKLIEDPAGEPLRCRTGIATGLAVIGGTTGSGNAREDAVAGQVLNLAARLQALAEPGGICVSPRVQELVGQLFEFDFAGEHSVRGFEDPIVAWRPVREVPHTNRFAAKHSIKRALVGRDEELALLTGQWSEVVSGDGRAVLILGEAGIGKSRLVEELHGNVSARPHAFVGWQCSAFHQTKPLYPVIEHITRAAGIGDGDDGPTQLTKLTTLLTAAEMPVQSTLPLFAGLLSLAPEAGSSPPDLTPAQRRSATIAALGEWMRRIAGQKPLLLILEDAHWADATTLEVMTLLIGAIGGVPLMAVITGRPEFAAPWVDQATVSVMGLERLNDRDCEGLIREIMAADDVSEATVEQIISRSDGNPLFVEELSAAVVGSGTKERQFVPDTLQGSLMARLDQLGDAKRTAQLCSVLGRRFARPLLAQLHDAPAVLDTNLSLLAAHDVVRPLGQASDGHYEFKHALLRDAAYESLLLAERRRLHERCARQLEENFPEVVQSEPELLAFHFAEGGLALEAANYLEQAGDRASANAAYIEAIASYRNALAQTAKLVEGEARDRRELGLLLRLGPALSIIYAPQSAGVRDAYQRAEALGRAVNDLDLRYKAVWGLWYHANVGRDYSRASDFADELVALSEQSHDDAQVLEALHCRWSSALFRGECTTAIPDATRGTKLYRRDRHHRLAMVFGGHDPGVCAHSVAASAQVTAGQFEAAIRNSLDAISLVEELHHPHSMAHALMNALTTAVTTRDFDLLQDWVERLAALAETYHFPLQRAVAAFFFEWRKAQSGNVSLDRLRSTFDALITVGPFTLLYTALFAEELLKAGRSGEALSVIDDFVGTLRFPAGFFLPEIYRVRGECLAALGRNDEAIGELRHAGEVAAAQGSELFALRAAVARTRSCFGDPERPFAIADIERSLAKIGPSNWPEIVAARDMLSAGRTELPVNRMSMQSAATPTG